MFRIVVSVPATSKAPLSRAGLFYWDNPGEGPDGEITRNRPDARSHQACNLTAVPALPSGVKCHGLSTSDAVCRGASPMTQRILIALQEAKRKPVPLGRAKPRSPRSNRVQAHPIAQLQAVLGNRRVAQLIQAKRISAEGKISRSRRKLTSDSSSDKSERRTDHVLRRISAAPNSGAVISRFPNAVTFGTYEPGLAIIPPIVKEGYDGSAHTAIKTNWGWSSWERRWRVYDGEDNLLYDSYYTYPHSTLELSKEIIAKGKAGGNDKPWSVWHEVTETEIPFGGDNPDNFPYAYMKFKVFETWNDFMADPDAKPPAGKQSEKPGQEPGKTSPVQSPTAKNAGSVVDYVSVVAMHEAYLRQIYDKAASGITATAQEMIGKGVPQTDVAKWANEARNVLKVKIRTDGNPILEKVFESRNLAKYGNKVGPTYEQLVAKYAKQGLSPEEIDAQIIKGASKANLAVNKWSGRLRVAGKITLFIDIAFAGVRVYLAPEGERTKVALEEVARIGGALAGGAAGTEAGVAVGAAVGAAFGGVGAVPGAIVGGILGGLGGAFLGGWAGRSAVDSIYDLLPPSDCVFEGSYQEETR